MEKINQIINYLKTPEFYYILGGGLLVIVMLFLLLKKKKGSSPSNSSFDNLIRNFIYVIVAGVLTLQIFIGIKKNTSQNRLEEDIDDIKEKQKDLEKKRQDIKKQIQDKNENKSKKQTKEKDIKEVSNKLKNLKK